MLSRFIFLLRNVNTRCTDNGNLRTEVIRNHYLIKAEPLSLLDLPALSKELFTLGRGKIADMAVRRGSKRIFAVRRNGKGKIGKSEHHAAHHLTVRTAVPFVKLKTAF